MENITIATIVEKVGTMEVNGIAVDAKNLQCYAEVSELSKEDLEKLVTLSERELRKAVKLLFEGESLGEYITCKSEDVMDHIERLDRDIEDIGLRA